mgnify:CR=1 FL=1
MITKYLLPASLALMVSSCVASTETKDSDDSTDTEPTKRCLATNPKDVQAWMNMMPGPGTGSKYPLHINFTATTGTPGYQFALKVNRVMESFPEQVVLDLIVTRPSGMVIQVVTENKVNLMLANFPGSEGSSVQVNCEGVPFFKIDKVMAAH